MKLRCLGSSSAGNCYILETPDEALIIEAGIKFMDVKKALGFNITKIVGVVASHSHRDHSAYLDQYRRSGIYVFDPYQQPDVEKQTRTYGNFVIKSFPLIHDVPCRGFLITHPEIGKLVYISDTEYVQYRFKSLNHILIEANYSEKYMEAGSVAKRTHVLTGHMSIETTLGFLEAHNSPELKNVALLHLSDSNSNESEFKMQAEAVVVCPVYVADKGMEIELC